jgi:Tfp pilus assembly protein PilF
MSRTILENLLKLLENGRDDALLRFSLGSEYFKHEHPVAAAEHLRAALKHDAGYSAAWKLLGRALEASGALEEALAAYREGMQIAERKGDKQAAKEMSVFARRLERAARDDAPHSEGS